MWFDVAESNVLGAILGIVFGLWGGASGTMVGFWAPKGKYRKFLMGAITLTICVGFVLLVIGFTALFSAQPRHIWYPFVLVGAVILPIYFYMRFIVNKTYREFKSTTIEEQNKF